MQKIVFVIWLMLINTAYMLFQKPYEASIVSWKSTGSVVDLSIRLLGRERRVNGTMTLSEDLGDDHISFGVDSYIDPFGSGDYKQMPYSVSDTAVCKCLKANWKYFDPTLIFGVNTDCPLHNCTDPIPKGVYYLKDVVIKPNNWPQFMPRGYILVIVTFKRDHQVIGTQEIGIRIVDRAL